LPGFVNLDAGAKFVFKNDEQGKVTGLVLLQAGMELPAARVKKRDKGAN